MFNKERDISFALRNFCFVGATLVVARSLHGIAIL